MEPGWKNDVLFFDAELVEAVVDWLGREWDGADQHGVNVFHVLALPFLEQAEEAEERGENRGIDRKAIA